MALIKTTDSEVQLFVGTDPYRYDVDNRPLRNLIANDIAMNTELVATTSEVVTARTDSSTGATITYSTLDARLEAMGISNAGNASISYAIFQSAAERNRSIYQSGFITQPTTKPYAETGTIGFTGDDFGGLMGSQWLGLTTYPNTMFINSDYDGQYWHVPLLVNGWLIKLFNMQAGGATAYGSHNAIKLTAPPTSGGRQDFVFLEVWLKEISAASPIFWLYGTPQYAASTYGEGTPVLNGNYVTNPLDARVVHTLSRLPNGNWLQVQHRFRVVPNVNPIDKADGFTGANATLTTAQGSQSAPIAGKFYTNMLGELADAGLWRAGNGPADTAALGTYDGYSWAVPVSMVHRRSSEDFTMANQNGSKKVGNSNSGTIASNVSGRPDGKYYDSITRDDFIDMRHWIDSYNVEFERLLQRSFNEVIRGATRLQWQQLQYTAGSQPVYGNRLLTNDTIFSDAAYPGYATDPNLGSNTNYVKDKSVSLAQFSRPDGVRRVFASYPIPQRVTFKIDPFAMTSDASVAGFVTFSSSGLNRTVTINPQVLSGGTGNTVGTRVPVWSWLNDSEPIDPLVGNGAGTSKTFTFNVEQRVSGSVLCNVDIMFPSKSGTENLPASIAKQEYFDGSATKSSWSSAQYDPYYPMSVKKDTNNVLYVAEFYASRISLWTENADGSLSKYHTISAANVTGGIANFSVNPISVAVFGDPMNGAGSGHIWLSDYYARRIRKYTYAPAFDVNGRPAGTWTLVQTVSTFTVSSVAREFGTTVGVHSIDLSPNGATLYAADQQHHVIWKFTTSNMSTATILAGTYDSAGNTATAPVKFSTPISVTADPNGTHVWVGDYGNVRVIKLDASGNPVLNITNVSGGGGGGMDNRVNQADAIRIIGTPGTTTVKYLVAAGHGIDAANQNRIFRLDYQWNVEAISSGLFPPSQTITRIGEMDVDSETSPNYVFVGITHPDTGLTTLRYSDLAIVNNRAYTSLGNFMRPRFYPASGAVTTVNLFAHVLLNGVRYVRRFTVASGVPTLAQTFSNPSGIGAIAEGHFSKAQNVSGIGWCFYEVITDSNFVSHLYRWTQSGGAWVRGGAAVVTPLPGTPWGIDLDPNGHLYMAFPGITGLGGVSHIVYRYKWDGANLVAPGGTGNAPGKWGTDGVPGSSPTTFATPTGIHVSANGAALAVIGKTTLPWSVGYDRNGDGSYNGFDDVDVARVVILDTTTAKWESAGQTPYLQDTVNQVATISGNLAGRPRDLCISGSNLYISTEQHTINRFTQAVPGDQRSYQYIGRLGVEGEPGNDHAHFNIPCGLAVSSLDSNRLIVADHSSSRLMSIHTKMAGVSLASGNIETMLPLTSAERLRVWSTSSAYQGIGTKVFTPGALEYIWTNQLLSSSEFLYVTSMGRSPLSLDTGVPVNLRGAIDRLPLSKTGGIDSSSFDSKSITFSWASSGDLSSPFLKLPIMTHGGTFTPMFDGLTEDSVIALVRDDASLTTNNMLRGYFTGNGSSATTFNSTVPTANPAQNRLVIQPYLIKRQGRVYLLVITVPMINTSRNSIGYPGADYYHALDLFEVPGRLLLR